VPGDLQCLNHRSCESVLLIPPLGSPQAHDHPEHHSWEQTVEQMVFVSKRYSVGAKTDQTQTPFCVWTNPDCNSTVDPNRAEQDFGEFRVQFVGPGF